MFRNPSSAEIRALLTQAKTIAVVGLSPNPERPSHRIARRLQEWGYRIVPVRPAVERVLGEKAYPRLLDVPQRIDLVDVFRAAQHLDPIVRDCIERKVPALWLQQGIVNDAAAARAAAAGIRVVMDRCIAVDYRHLVLQPVA
ncbi:MAG TPA: CoA-binding protein [Burkholderiales bacterium]|nr:CoA-binding protein [Burkholderiales bacterium]